MSRWGRTSEPDPLARSPKLLHGRMTRRGPCRLEHAGDEFLELLEVTHLDHPVAVTFVDHCGRVAGIPVADRFGVEPPHRSGPLLDGVQHLVSWCPVVGAGIAEDQDG